jgi:hypothetical protein
VILTPEKLGHIPQMVSARTERILPAADVPSERLRPSVPANGTRKSYAVGTQWAVVSRSKSYAQTSEQFAE